ncbi:hypothetical protein Rhe02_75100 [Rhizocola hellebori]|uniref:DUF58 domain-containing protein n=1 Tax=Rhizocola hellebori TaxID=1392758 RepID=A0A8J3QHC0_9ACTN|nr:DUF58 domain-containing protein [Rhizocola hellebori]GIH09443.1 hypothetical protein Rhe02_75100 [Rhizocola hellebori]
MTAIANAAQDPGATRIVSVSGMAGSLVRSVVHSTVLRRTRIALRVPTQLGWTVMGTGAAAGVLGWFLAWTELRMIALFCVVLMVYAGLYTFGKADLEVDVDVETPWVDRKEKATVKVDVVAKNRLRGGASLEVPIAVGRQRPEVKTPPLGSLSRGALKTVDLSEFIPTAKRGVVAIGPVQTVRGDPIGLLRRPMSLAERKELVVKPDTVVIASLGAGMLKDLEGKATNERSASDVSFHSLRDYVPGDDLRHVHAVTSARFGKPMVRQFVDTRTAHLSIVVSGAEAEYGSEQEFEDAISIAGSIAVRGVDDDQRVAVLAAGQHTPTRSRQSRSLILDPFARAEFGAGLALVAGSRRMKRLVPDTSIAVLVTGGRAGEMELRKGARVFGPDVRCIAIQVKAGSDIDVARARRLLVVSVPSLGGFGTIGSIFGKGWS